jgi:Rap1a immunity proteins
VAYAGTAQAQGGFLTGNELLTYCKGGDSKDQAQCLGYIEGVVDTLAFSPLPLSCRLSGGVTVGQLKDVVVNALIADPTERHFAAFSLVRSAIADAGFCQPPWARGGSQ